MSALLDAIGRSFESTSRNTGDDSPMRVLGRRQLSGYEVFAQSVATTAPAASMVIFPTALIAHGSTVGGLLTLIAVVVGTVLAAMCLTQFTRRMISPGGLYTFTSKGLGGRGALTSGAAILLKYLASASMTLYYGSDAVADLLAHWGIGTGGIGTRLVVCGLIAAGIVAALARGAKIAAVVILTVESCSLIFIVGLMFFAGSSPEHVAISADSGLALTPLWLTAVFALMGFESATFLGSEAKRPYVTVTRTVIWTPVVCGLLFLIGGWAAATGRANAVVDAFLFGSSDELGNSTVLLLQFALAFSWLASAMASSNAASRALFAMGMDGVLPRGLARVHSRFRTPVAGLVVAGGLATVVAVAMICGAHSAVLPILDIAGAVGIVTAYLLISVAAMMFLGRIGEITIPIRALCVVSSASCVAALVAFVPAEDGWRAMLVCATFAILILGSYLWWLWLRRIAPGRLTTIGAFDRADSADVLPGAAAYGHDLSGALVLVADKRDRLGL